MAQLQLSTDLGALDALEFGARGSPLVIAIQGKSANLDVITEWEPACRLLAASGYHVVLPNLHSNERTKPGTVAASDVQQIIRGIYQHCGAETAVVMGKSWGGGEVVAFAAAHASMVTALVLVAPHLSDVSLLREIANVPTSLFWARDDPVKSFELADNYTSCLSNVVLRAVDTGGHRVLDQYLPDIQAAVARAVPGAKTPAQDAKE